MSYDAYNLYYDTMLNWGYDTLTASTLGLLAHIIPLPILFTAIQHFFRSFWDCRPTLDRGRWYWAWQLNLASSCVMRYYPDVISKKCWD